MAKLKLLVDSYDQPQSSDKPNERKLRTITKGELFEPVSSAEAERLVEIGAALDPKEAAAQAQAEAEAKAQVLRDQAAELEAQADEAAQVEGDLSSLTKPELVERAKAAGIEGYSDLNKAELLEALGEG